VRLEFHPDAAEEFSAAAEYYETAISGLGFRFLGAVREVSERVLAHPEIGMGRGNDTRRVLVPGFPYDLVYRVTGELVQILALAHQRRRPGYWKDRIGD
jgi:toxin ParE1/3/4